MFGFLGFQYAYPWLQSFIDFSDMGKDTSEEVSEEVSGDVSEESSVPVIKDNYDENGDIFTAVILCADSHNRALNIAFIDANGKTKQYIYCPILSSVKKNSAVYVGNRNVIIVGIGHACLGDIVLIAGVYEGNIFV